MLTKQRLGELRVEILSEWRNKYGQIQIFKRGYGQGEPDNVNGNIFDGYTFTFLHLFNLLKVTDREKAIELIDNNRTLDKSGDVVPGYFNRRPSTYEEIQEGEDVVSHDEYSGIVAMAYILKRTDIIEEIVQAGLKNGFSYNNKEVETQGIVDRVRYTRQGVNTFFYKIMAEYEPTILEYIWFISSVFFTLFKDKTDTDGKMMAWMKLELAKEKSQIIWFTYWAWKLILKRIYKNFEWKGKYYGPLETIFRIYFEPEDFPLQEFAEHWDETFL